jgi:5-dehydro-4-deoxyglucarate dehydratase
VALIKAGVGIAGRPVGHARAPLLDPTAEHAAELKAIVERGLALVKG